MSKEPIKKAAARPKAQLGGAALGNLMAAAGSDTRGDPIRIPLADIDEDPDQPRQTFDQAELESMAESIRDLGVIQAIVVKPPQAGRYMLVAGARRYRASKLAGMKDIPAIVRAATEGNFAAQVVENTQRANLTNSELAEAVARFVEEGRTSKQIAAICNLKDYQVAAFRKVADFPPQLRERINAADMRALYDLYRVWEKGAEQITQALEAFDAANPGATLTITEARRIASSVTGKPTGSIVLDRAAVQPAPAPAPAPARAETQAPAEPAPQDRSDTEADQGSTQTSKPAPAPTLPESTNRAPSEKPADAQPALIAAPAPAPKPAGPVFIVRVGGGAEGRLIVDRRAEKPGRALVELDGTIEEVDPAEIGLVRIE
jgi:ParB family chromosome partitioning protein